MTKRESPSVEASCEWTSGPGWLARRPTDGLIGRGAETRSPQGQALGRQRSNLRGRGGLLSESRRAVARNDDGEKTRGHDPGSHARLTFQSPPVNNVNPSIVPLAGSNPNASFTG